MKKLLFLLFLMAQYTFGQVSYSEKFPVFPACQNTLDKDLEDCFYNQIQDFVYTNFQIPDVVKQKEYKGKVIVLFEVDSTGTFKVQYVDAVYPELAEESKRVFGALPKIEPATYNGKPTYAKYTMHIAIPLQSAADLANEKNKLYGSNNDAVLPKGESDEFGNVENNYQKFSNPHLTSNLNIPFSHSFYSQFDDEMNQVGTNSHTGSKPFTYAEVSKYYDLVEAYKKLELNKTSWLGRKIFNENLVAIQGKDYWFTMNPILDLRMGKADPSTENYTFVNTRAIQIQGGLGSQFNFTASIFESQGVFADYYNRYAASIKPSGGNPAIIPGIGIAKGFKDTNFDFPSADANITYAPSKFFNLQLGYSRNFIGDGYRSLLQGDGASPYPFFKINTTFWKIKYTNTYMWLKDVRPTDVVLETKTYSTKFMANHYLSWNVSKKWNLGFFESVVWANTNDRGFDMSFVNPVIFFRSVEFSSSSKSGNAVLGLTTKLKWNNSVNFYGQFLLDEFALGDMKSGEKSWRNKYGYQIGVKYYNAFGVSNLLLQAEYNRVRPYTYAHSNPLTNYGHNNQSMGHNWGSNFNELTGIARYTRGRLFANAQVSVGVRGFDFDTAGDNLNYGSNIYKDYDDYRAFEKGVEIGQGNKTKMFIADFQAGYLVNPHTNLKVFGNILYRSMSPEVDTAAIFKENTTWFSIGLRADVFNWYFDY